MHCAECGKPLQLFGTLGAYRQCCRGIGYWHDQPPVATDRWVGIVRFRGIWTLYRNLFRWPAGLKFALPNG